MGNRSDKETAQARVLELKADGLAQKSKFRKALDTYAKALEIDSERIELYDKMLATQEQFSDSWTEDDFSINLWLTMTKQEILDPTFKRLHARHEPEFKEVMGLVRKMMVSKKRETETKYVEEIVSWGEHALYPLIDALLRQKELEGKRKETMKLKLKKK